MVMSFSFAWAWANTLATISPVSVFLSYSSVICCPLAFSSFSALTSLLNLLVSLSMSRIAIFSLQLRPCQFQFSFHELFFLFLKVFFLFFLFRAMVSLVVLMIRVLNVIIVKIFDNIVNASFCHWDGKKFWALITSSCFLPFGWCYQLRMPVWCCYATMVCL